MKRDKNENRIFPVARERLTTKRLIGWLFIAVVVVMAVGALKAEARTARDSRFYYVCELPDFWIARMIRVDAVRVLSWKDFKREAWDRGFPNRNTPAFYDNTTAEIFLKASFTDIDLFHELGHSYQYSIGKYGHNEECWSTELPFRYDDVIAGKLEGFGYLRD